MPAVNRATRRSLVVARLRAILLACCTAVFALAIAPPTHAGGVAVNEATEEQKDAAREAYKRGKTAMDAGNLEDALTAFRESHGIIASPNPHFMVVRVLQALGRNAEAYAEAVQVIRESDAASRYSARYGQTAKAARAKLAELQPLLAMVEVNVVAPQGGTLTVGGRTIDIADWSKPIAAEPGTVTVELTTPEGVARRDLQMAAGAKEQVHLEVTRGKQPLPDRPVPKPDVEPDEDDGGSGLMPYTVLGYAVGGVGMLGFAIFGSLTLGEYSDLEEKCPTNSCRPEATEEADSGRSFQTAANVSLVIGIVGLAAGTALLITDLSGDDGADSGSEGDPEADADAASIDAISVGPGSISIIGSF